MDDAEFDAGLQQIRHEYDMLLKEKHSIETFFEEVSSQVETKDGEIASLRKRNAQYAAVLRHFQRVEADYKAVIEQLMADLSDAAKKNVPRLAGFSALPENLHYVDKDIREMVERRVAPIDHDDALHRADVLCKEREKEISDMRRQRARCDNEIQSLREQLAEYATVIAALRKSSERQQQTQAAPTEERPLAVEMQREVIIEVPAEIEEELMTLRAALHAAQREQREQQDQIDELQASLAATEEELRALAAKKARKPKAAAYDEPEEEEEEDELLEMGEDRTVVRGFKGLTRAEQDKIFAEKFKLMEELDELKDTHRELAAKFACLNATHNKAIQFSKARDKFVEEHLSKKSLKESEMKKLLALLRSTSLDFDKKL